MKNRVLKDAEVEKDKRMARTTKKNLKRIGGGGLSLDAFANAKSGNSHYNPALIKKQREFYKNAKQLKKFKKLKMQRSQQDDVGTSNQDENRTEDNSEMGRSKKNNIKFSLDKLYEKKHEEKVKARMEREAIMQAKKEKIQNAEVQRKAMREKMFKRTRTGQPVMKYRIEHILETLQSSASSSADK